MKKIFFLLPVFILLFSACGEAKDLQDTQEVELEQPTQDINMMMEKDGPNADKMMKEIDKSMMMEIKDKDFAYSATLLDVTEGKEVGGVTTSDATTGLAKMIFADDVYTLYATFSNLPEPNGEDFYEGWVVRKDPFHFISTGRLEKVDGVYSNSYMSETDLVDHGLYVLTIEPSDDGVDGGPDPAPAGHILEGPFKTTQ